MALTLKPPPAGLTHWSTRDLADASGACRTPRSIGFGRPTRCNRIASRRSSTAPTRTRKEKIYDVVGLYLQPPQNAVVLSVDEKTQIQALSRTQPLLPMRPGLPARRTHDYRRNGLTSLYAAFNVTSGEVIGACSAAPHGRRVSRLPAGPAPALSARATCTSFWTTRRRTRPRRFARGWRRITRESNFISPPLAPRGSIWWKSGLAS